MFTVVFYGVAALALVASLVASRAKTGAALKKAWKALAGILPQFVAVVIVSGIVLAFLDPASVSVIVGEESGWSGVVGAAVVGSITLMPGFVAFPLASLLVERGAGLMQVAAFVSSLMMVGVMTFPMERRVFGTRLALARNVLAFGFSIAVAAVLAVVLGMLP